MKKTGLRLIALIAALCLLLTGCLGVEDYHLFFSNLLLGKMPVVRFSDMEYTRPDPDALMDYYELCVELAEAGEDFDALEENIWLLYDAYYDFYTQYSLADIHYSMNMADIYWDEEYSWCMEAAVEVDAVMDQLFYVLAACPFRQELEQDALFGEGFFDDYDGQSVWDDTFIALMDQEAELFSEYYALTEELMAQEPGSFGYDAKAMELAGLYAEMIALRQEQALHSGYANYMNFAYEFYYDRDYTPSQAVGYLEQIQTQLTPLYRRVCTQGVDGIEYAEVSEADTFAYVEAAARNMGGAVEEAFDLMQEAQLYDISEGENKYEASFEVFLLNYYEPFVFVNPSGTSYDKLTFAHEFGHFCNDYASQGSMLEIDAMEVFSQGMEYLSLAYADGTEGLAKLKMVDSLCVYVEQAAYAAFEHEAYKLQGDALTAENLMELYVEVTDSYGFDIWESDGLDFVTIPHFFTNPMYVFSYVVSNDAAMQLYQMEQMVPGSGLEAYQQHLTADDDGFLAFLRTVGLESPFDEGRIEMVRETFEEILG